MLNGDGNGRVNREDDPADPGGSLHRVPDCPPWCDGSHEADDAEAAYHGRIVAQVDGATVALCCAAYHDPFETGSPVIILMTDVSPETTELDASDAISLLGVIEAAGDRSSWLAGALRSALDLLDRDVR